MFGGNLMHTHILSVLFLSAASKQNPKRQPTTIGRDTGTRIPAQGFKEVVFGGSFGLHHKNCLSKVRPL